MEKTNKATGTINGKQVTVEVKKGPHVQAENPNLSDLDKLILASVDGVIVVTEEG